jgi:hypothetical protein
MHLNIIVHVDIFRWYVIRAQAYVDARPGWRRKEHKASNLTDYLNVLGRKSGLKELAASAGNRCLRILQVEMAGLDKAIPH